jgi:hypothetical protein
VIEMGEAGHEAVETAKIAHGVALQPENPAEHATGGGVATGAEGVLRGAGLPGGGFRAGGAFPEAGGAQPRGLGGTTRGVQPERL